MRKKDWKYEIQKNDGAKKTSALLVKPRVGNGAPYPYNPQRVHPCAGQG